MKQNEKSYHVYNSEILNLFYLWKETSKEKKNIVQSKIIERMNPVIYNKTKKFKNLNFYEDLLQESRIAIMTALERFDPLRCPNFFSYSIFHIKNRIRSYLEKNKQNMTDKLPILIDENSNPVVKYEKNEMMGILLLALEKLSIKDKKVISMKLGLEDNHYTYQDIGETLGVSKQYVEQICKSAITKLQNDKNIKEYSR
jgi:RNA polymerase sigma factor (sigma-70 family)